MVQGRRQRPVCLYRKVRARFTNVNSLVPQANYNPYNRFATKADYRAHQKSAHLQGLYQEYIQYITEPFVSYPIDTFEKLIGGFEMD